GAKWQNSHKAVTGISKFSGSFRSVVAKLYKIVLLCNIARNEGEISSYPTNSKTYRLVKDVSNATDRL
ncbi:hypothetical protein X801_02913, partial [Opisthorchis viverrini]